MTEAHIAQVARLYADFKADGPAADVVRVFDNQSFAYIKLTVERPLRLNFQLSPERIRRVQTASAFMALAESKKRKDLAGMEADIAAGKKEQAAILKVLEALAAKHGQKLYKDRAEFSKLPDAAFKKADNKLPAALRKAVF